MFVRQINHKFLLSVFRTYLFKIHFDIICLRTQTCKVMYFR